MLSVSPFSFFLFPVAFSCTLNTIRTYFFKFKTGLSVDISKGIDQFPYRSVLTKGFLTLWRKFQQIRTFKWSNKPPIPAFTFNLFHFYVEFLSLIFPPRSKGVCQETDLCVVTVCVLCLPLSFALITYRSRQSAGSLKHFLLPNSKLILMLRI